MPKHPEDHDCDDELDPEGPDESEMDFSDDPDLEVCPNCRKLITEEAHRCPHCGEHVILSETPLPKWAWIVVLIVALTALGFALRL